MDKLKYGIYKEVHLVIGQAFKHFNVNIGQTELSADFSNALIGCLYQLEDQAPSRSFFEVNIKSVNCVDVTIFSAGSTFHAKGEGDHEKIIADINEQMKYQFSDWRSQRFGQTLADEAPASNSVARVSNLA